MEKLSKPKRADFFTKEVRIIPFAEAYRCQKKYSEALEDYLEELESAWEYLNGYISMNYSDCSSLPELCDGFGVRKDGQKKEIWEVVREGLLEYDKEMGIEAS